MSRGAPRGAGGSRPTPRRWRLVRARSEAVPASVRRFNQRARDRRLRAARPWFVALCALALLLGVGWVVGETSLLGVRSVRVVGNELVDAQQVREAAAIAAGTPLIRLDLDGVSRRVVSRLAPVRRAVVHRDWPSSVVITVTERVGVATVHRPDKSWVVLDGTGVSFQSLAAQPAGLAVIEVSDPGPTDPSTLAALQVLDALTPELRAALVTLQAPLPTRIRLVLQDNRQIVWGDATQNAAKARVATTMLARSGSVIDVSAPGFVTVD